MARHNRVVVCVLCFLLSVTMSGASAQIGGTATIKSMHGDTVQPAFEGWEKNADGTYNMWFGYLNRNWAQELNIPVGPENNVQPGGPDRGQPEFFQTGAAKRRQMFAFKVVVPADWPKDRDLVWTLTSHGTTLKAYASLRPDYMVDVNVFSANRGAQRDTDPLKKNTPPTIIEAPKDQSIAVGAPLALKMTVKDDGMPKPFREFDRGTEGTTDLRRLLRVSWLQWRGPGRVKFEPDAMAVTDATGTISRDGGSATTKAIFDRPGKYVVMAYAEDMSLFSMHTFTVNVTAAAASGSN